MSLVDASELTASTASKAAPRTPTASGPISGSRETCVSTASAWAVLRVGRDRFVKPLQVAAPGALEPRRRFLVGEEVVGVLAARSPRCSSAAAARRAPHEMHVELGDDVLLVVEDLPPS